MKRLLLIGVLAALAGCGDGGEDPAPQAQNDGERVCSFDPLGIIQVSCDPFGDMARQCAGIDDPLDFAASGCGHFGGPSSGDGTSSGGGSTPPPPILPDPPILAAGEVALFTTILDWIPPSTNTDGSTLLDLSGYTIAFSGAGGAGPTTYMDLDNPGLVTYVLDLPGPGEWAISMTAHNSADEQSASSNVVTVIIDGPSPITNPSEKISYSFITGVSNSSIDPTLEALFAGMLVSGTFDYDSNHVATGVADGSRAPDSVIYAGNIANVVGSANGMDFSDPGGLTVVGNDRYVPTGLTDILTVSTGQLNLAGFEINGFRLVTVRMFWIEGQLGIVDFLSSENLPTALPDFEGRLALDFTPTSNPGAITSVFFDGLLVSPTP